MNRSIDVELVSMGYIRSPAGRWRHIPGLDEVARETVRHGVRVIWGRPESGGPGCARLWSSTIVLAPYVFDAPGWAVVDLWAHELGHCVRGASCVRAREWQEWRFADVLRSPVDEVA